MTKDELTNLSPRERKKWLKEALRLTVESIQSLEKEVEEQFGDTIREIKRLKRWKKGIRQRIRRISLIRGYLKRLDKKD